MGKSITFTLTLPSLPELPALPDDPWVWAEALGWLVLVLLLLRVLSQLSAIYALLRPHAAKPPALLEMPALLLRKARLVLYGACFLVLSKDKVTSKQLKKAPDAAHATGPVEKKVRLVFIRHGESMWNYAFNRGFKPSFLYLAGLGVSVALVGLLAFCLLHEIWWGMGMAGTRSNRLKLPRSSGSSSRSARRSRARKERSDSAPCHVLLSPPVLFLYIYI